MRIESVTAHAFGPFIGERLDLAPAFNVIFGPNESGKSTWHAALYIALCGMRRSRGRPAKEDEVFTSFHRPWDTDRWEVSAVISLADGRRIELRHDLAGRVDCRAMDLATGRDVSDEIMDGTPDASRWLGLDRRSFLATACVRQADLLGVLNDPDLLQEHLQRAAATAGTDATAAAAIAALEDFRREHVGADVAHSRKPLRAAKNEVHEAERALQLARQAHDAFLRLASEADRADKAAADVEGELRMAQAAMASNEARELRVRLARARVLQARFPDGPPGGIRRDDELGRQVATAIRSWEQQPDSMNLDGPSAADLQRQLDAIPEAPRGDLEPHPRVEQALEQFRTAGRTLEILHQESQPEPEPPRTGGLTDQQLLDLARDLEMEEPAVSLAAQTRVEAARTLAMTSKRGRLRLGAGIGIPLAILGVALLAVGLPFVGSIGLVLGVSAAAWGFVTGTTSEARGLRELRSAEEELGRLRFDRDAILRRRDVATSTVVSAGLPLDVNELRRLASVHMGYEERRAAHRSSVKRLDDASQSVHAAFDGLAEALRGRGIHVSDDPEEAYLLYVEECRHCRSAAGQSARRTELAGRVVSRRELEEAAGKAEQARNAAWSRLRAVADQLGVAETDGHRLTQALRTWEAERTKDLEKAEEAVRAWTELDGLLAGRSIEDMEQEVLAAEQKVTVLTGGDVAKTPDMAVDTSPGVDIEMMQGRANQARSSSAELRGRVESEAQRLPSVAEAEERFAQARDELDRVRGLQRTIGHTLQYLEEAQDRVHRDIAPVLAATVQDWLPRITIGRYVETVVDPATLTVKVKSASGKWRQAGLLSHGTSEQIYLLLRLSLAGHLVRPEEKTPLILDDVSVQCDTGRTAELMAILHEASADRQVVFFTQDEDAIAWAERQLEGAQHRIIKLSEPIDA